MIDPYRYACGRRSAAIYSDHNDGMSVTALGRKYELKKKEVRAVIVGIWAADRAELLRARAVLEQRRLSGE